MIRRVKTKSGADAVAKKFGEDKEFRTRAVPNKKKNHAELPDEFYVVRQGIKKDYTKPSWE